MPSGTLQVQNTGAGQNQEPWQSWSWQENAYILTQMELWPVEAHYTNVQNYINYVRKYGIQNLKEKNQTYIRSKCSQNITFDPIYRSSSHRATLASRH
jgi:hypothetical protein